MTWPDRIAAQTSFIRQQANALTRDWDQAKDLAQDVVLHALENEHNFEPGNNLKGWLKRMGHNLFVNQYRRNVKFQKVEQATDGLYVGYAFLGHNINEGAYTYDIELIERVVGKIKNKKDARIMRLRMQGYKYEEIAEETGVPLGSVRSSIHRCRGKLQPLLEIWVRERRVDWLRIIIYLLILDPNRAKITITNKCKNAFIT